MKTPINMVALEEAEQKWVDAFARRSGWKDVNLQEPDEAINLMLEAIPGPSLLDVGCGWGSYIYRFLDHGLTYTGLDLSKEMLSAARAAYPACTFVQGTSRNLPFLDELFDGVWCCCALESIPKAELAGVMKEMSRVLRIGGVMVIVAPSLCRSEEEPILDETGAVYRIRSLYYQEEFLEKLAGLPLSLVAAHDKYYTCGAMWFLFRKT